MAKKKKKSKAKPLDVEGLEDGDQITYYVNFDDFCTQIMLTVHAPKPLNPEQWYSCLKSFLDDIENEDIDLDAIFDEGFSGTHH